MRLMRSHNLAYFRWFLEHENPACTSLYKRDFMRIQAIQNACYATA